jgi:hypothetical protein
MIQVFTVSAGLDLAVMQLRCDVPKRVQRAFAEKTLLVHL